VGGCLFVLLGLLCSVVGSIVVFYGFTLTCGGDDLHRAYGLFTRRASSLPRRRIQVLKIEESWVRRLLGLATLRVDTAGSQAAQGPAGKSGRDAVLPIIWRKEIAGLLPVFFPDLDVSGDWRQVSRRAIRRGTVKGSAICLLLAGVTLLLQKSALGLWPLAFIPLVYFLNVLSYRYLGYRHGADYFWTRQGWLSRTTHIVPVRNVQAIVIRQTPLDRWHRVATVLVETAGQAYTGGGPHIANVPQADALALARTLAQKAAQTRYRW
jgi:putative membrane protein